MPDKRSNHLFANNVHVFDTVYADGTTVGMWVHPKVGSKSTAMKFKKVVANSVGTLPTLMRKHLSHVVINPGDYTAFAEVDGRFFVIYAQNITKRIYTHDFKETAFHEAVHATLDNPLLKSRAWCTTQRKDRDFVTEYAKNHPNKEDMAESALFAWAILQHPGQLPTSIEKRVKRIMPNRLAYFKKLFTDSGPAFQKIGPVGKNVKEPVSFRRASHPVVWKFQMKLHEPS